MAKEPKIIIAGGGTGGHVFPAIAIANAIKTLEPQAHILFIGAQDRLEMQKVPEAGYEIIGLPVKGLRREFSLQNLKTIYLLFSSISRTKRIFKKLRPDVVVGVGGYASAPALHVASHKKIPIILQEQNSFPGITNRIYGKHAKKICAAYEEVKKYLSEDKVIITGNPVMEDIINTNIDRSEALKHFGLSPERKTLLVTGGSLGARQLNNSVIKNLDMLRETEINLLWQTGKYYYNNIAQEIKPQPWLKIMPFIDKMPLAYKAADVIIARAGAITISELSIMGKAVIFVPSPNVAEDHQKKNALALVNKNAALMVEDSQAIEQLIPTAIQLMLDNEKIARLEENIKQFAKPEAAKDIAKIILYYATGEEY